MANKKTVVEMYKEILSVPGLTDEQKAFIEKRIEITQKKNASGKSGELTPKQKEKMAADATIEDRVVAVMAEGVQYNVGNLVKLVDMVEVATPQKLTPRLTALVKAERICKDTVKGRSVYFLPSTNEVEGE